MIVFILHLSWRRSTCGYHIQFESATQMHWLRVLINTDRQTHIYFVFITWAFVYILFVRYHSPLSLFPTFALSSLEYKYFGELLHLRSSLHFIYCSWFFLRYVNITNGFKSFKIMTFNQLVSYSLKWCTDLLSSGILYKYWNDVVLLFSLVVIIYK